MTPVWPPIAALLLSDLRTPASPEVVRWLLRADPAPRLLYIGDRMWPALAHNQEIVLERLPPGDSYAAGLAVVCIRAGALDVLRIHRGDGPSVLLRGDAETGPGIALSREDLLAAVHTKAVRVSSGMRTLRRSLLELAEAWNGAPVPEGECSARMRAKYDLLAPFYPEPELAAPDGYPVELVRSHAPLGARVLLAGCGTGPECFRLARAGWSVVGVDSSAGMIARAKRASERLGVDVRFVLADIRSVEVEAGSQDCVLLGGGMYSFLEGRKERTALLRRAAGWLSVDGVILLSATMAAGAWSRLVLTVRWLRRASVAGSWGDANARWIAPDGAVGRTFLRVFTERGLRRETADAGLDSVRWHAGHLVLRRR